MVTGQRRPCASQADGNPSFRRAVLLALTVGLLAMGPLVRDGLAGALGGMVATAILATFVLAAIARRDRALLVLLFGAFAIRVAVFGLDEVFTLFPKLDALGYHHGAAQIANGWWNGELFDAPHNSKMTAYEVAIAPLYWVFGPHAWIARLFNGLVGSLAVYNVYRIGQTMQSRQVGLVAASLLAVFPSVVRLHSEHLREALVLLLITQVFYLLLSRRHRSVSGVILMVASLGWLWFLRQPTLLVIGAVVLGVVGLGSQLNPWSDASPTQTRGGRWGSIGLRLALLGGTLGLAYQLGVQDSVYASWLSPEQLTEVRDSWALGGSRYLSDIQFTSWWDVLWFLPVGGIFFLFTPFPWHVDTVLGGAALAENVLVFYPVTVLAILGFRDRAKDLDLAALAVFLFSGTMLFGLIEGNVGTAIRHRAQFTWVLFLFAASYVANIVDWVQVRRTLAPLIERLPEPYASDPEPH